MRQFLQVIILEIILYDFKSIEFLGSFVTAPFFEYCMSFVNVYF
ncbi:hypothetical protein UABAM_03702 [Candidatus Uabimicrobium amorphum]|uniref:Uncharacterized protein n=1 Tax=Uabimicrobium amorphum TaxID=2596890 RepID=A0A5S9IPP8_UABAM|nr:hypothetical protein UABAM_03702 [Candidatus Uabimicrobium amorphum]